MSIPSEIPKPKRFLPVTLLGWAVALVGLALTPVSFISLLMILAGSYGTKTSDPLGFFLVIVAPPLAVLVGIGLVFRWRWAWLCLVAALVAVLSWQAVEWRRPPAGPPVTTVSPSGVRITTYRSGPQVSLPLVVVCLVLLVLSLTKRVRRDFGWSRLPGSSAAPPPLPLRGKDPSAVKLEPTQTEGGRGWRVGHQGRDRMYYEEWREGGWQRIDIDGEMLTGRAHHVIYFPSPETWRSLPAWACDRREEIIARTKSEFREPDYEYFEHAVAGGASVGSPIPSPPARGATRSGQRAALLWALLILLGLAGWMGWWVARGWTTGRVPFPSSKSALRRMVVRETEPAMFWVCLGLYAGVGAGSLGLIVWGWRQSREGKG